MHNPYEITSRKPRHRENSTFVVLQVRGSGQLPVHLLLVLLVLVLGKRVRCAVRCYCDLAASNFFWDHPCRNHRSCAPEREPRGNAAIEQVDKNQRSSAPQQKSQLCQTASLVLVRKHGDQISPLIATLPLCLPLSGKVCAFLGSLDFSMLQVVRRQRKS